MIQIALVNGSTVVADADLVPIVAALQIQVTRDFAPAFGVDASLAFVPRGAAVPAGAWTLEVADKADEPGALGYHQTKLGIPWGIIGAQDDIDNGGSLSVTISHELLEMLADPHVNRVAIIDTQIGGFRGGLAVAVAYEVCDVCEADQFAYDINGVKVSDFVFDHYFGGEVPEALAGKYSFTGAVKEAFGIDTRRGVHGILSGGYLGVRQFRTAGGWTTVSARHIDDGQELEAKINAMLPGNHPHILLADGTTQSFDKIPAASRRARVLKNLAA